MSGSIKVARAAAQGDPGIFGDIFGGIKGAIGGFLGGGPLGAISGAAKGAFGNKPGPAGLTPNMQAAIARAQAGKPLSAAARNALQGRGIAIPMPILKAGPGFGPQATPVTRTPGIGGFAERLLPGGATGFEVAGMAAQGGMGTSCPPGFHPNKSSYWTSQGFVPAGAKCVRNRRRNPMNPRALSRAISRVESAKKASSRLGRITVRKKCK